MHLKALFTKRIVSIDGITFVNLDQASDLREIILKINDQSIWITNYVHDEYLRHFTIYQGKTILNDKLTKMAKQLKILET